MLTDYIYILAFNYITIKATTEPIHAFTLFPKQKMDRKAIVYTYNTYELTIRDVQWN